METDGAFAHLTTISTRRYSGNAILPYVACTLLALGAANIHAQFQPQVTKLSLGSHTVPDPEFDSQEKQITWLDGRNLWVASVDPDSGDVVFAGAQKLASNCAPMFPMEGTRSHGNGPEWMYTSEGSKILFTMTKSNGPGWKIGVAEKNTSGWNISTPPELTNIDGGVPEGSRQALDSDPYFYYHTNSSSKRKAVHVRQWNNLTADFEIPFETTSPPRFSLQDKKIITCRKIGSTIQAIEIDLGTKAVEQLTFEKNLNKDETFAWRAPEFANDPVFIAAEKKRAGGEATQIGVYRKVANKWNRVKTIFPPTGRKFKLPHSPEPFVFKGKSYVVFSVTTRNAGRDGVEIWIAGIGNENFYRRIAGPEHGIKSTDPEVFIGNDKAFVFLAQAGGKEIFRAATGL
jgi:hypothetical protein